MKLEDLLTPAVRTAIRGLAPTGAGTGDVVGPAGATDGHLAVFDGATGKLLKDGGAGGGSGDVVGPASAVNHRFAMFDGTTGKLIEDSGHVDADYARAAHDHGTGTDNRITQWNGVAGALEDSAIVPPASNVLTITNAAAATLGINVSAGKTLTLTCTDNFTLTIPATGTPALLATANAFTVGGHSIATGADATKGLIAKQNSATQSGDLFEWAKSDGTVLGGIDGRGNLITHLGSSTTNLFIGPSAGNGTNTGIENTCIGYQTGLALTDGGRNVLIGYGVGAAINTGDFNVCIGRSAGASITDGQSNFALGYYSLSNITTQSSNVAIGNQSLKQGTTVATTTAVGDSTGQSVTGSGNTWIGAYAAGTYSAGVRTNYYNTAVGYRSQYASAASQNSNTTVGYDTLYTGGGSNNVAIGYYAGRYETAGAKLFIDSFDRTNEAGGRSSSLIYGVFNSTVASQSLVINGAFTGTYSGVFNEIGGDYDFRIESDNYDAFFVDASNDAAVLMNNASGKIGFFAATPVTRHAHIADATDAATVITVANHILSVLEEYGLLAAS